MSDDDKLAQAQAALDALGSMLQGIKDVASAAGALRHQQLEQSHDAAELEERLRGMAEALTQPATDRPIRSALQQQLHAALKRAQASGHHSSGGLQPNLELHHGEGLHPAANVAELRRQAQLAAHTGLGLPLDGPPDLGEQVVRMAQLAEAESLSPSRVLLGLLLGAQRYALQRDLEGPEHWPARLAVQVLDQPPSGD